MMWSFSDPFKPFPILSKLSQRRLIILCFVSNIAQVGPFRHCLREGVQQAKDLTKTKKRNQPQRPPRPEERDQNLRKTTPSTRLLTKQSLFVRRRCCCCSWTVELAGWELDWKLGLELGGGYTRVRPNVLFHMPACLVIKWSLVYRQVFIIRYPLISSTSTTVRSTSLTGLEWAEWLARIVDRAKVFTLSDIVILYPHFCCSQRAL